MKTKRTKQQLDQGREDTVPFLERELEQARERLADTRQAITAAEEQLQPLRNNLRLYEARVGNLETRLNILKRK